MQPVKRQISSSMTFIVKYVLSTLAVAVIGVISLVCFVAAVSDAMHGPSASRLDAVSGPLMVLFLILLVGGSVSYLILRQARLLKAVSVDNDFLYVSNFRKETKVPLSEVASVRASFLLRGKFEPASVGFKGETEFGRRIAFIPHFRLFAVGIHPAVKELGSLVVAKGGGTARR